MHSKKKRAAIAKNSTSRPHTHRLNGRAAPASLSRCLLRLASHCVDGRVNGLEHLNQNLRISIERLHHAVHDLCHVVEIDIEVRLGQHTDDAELNLLDPDVDAGG